MAPHWRGGAQVLAVTLGILQCCGWLSGQTVRTSVGMMERGSEQWSAMSHERVKRGWVWNQFFVVEEYTGTEPLYVGKVGLPHFCHVHVFVCSLIFLCKGKSIASQERCMHCAFKCGNSQML